VVHIASHFRFTPGTNADSYLLLGDDGRLTLEELWKRDYRFSNVDLLTLSACETALGDGADAGGEVEGLGALVQKRGAKSVLATLWSVADATTGLFMRTLYEQRQQPDVSKAEALRRAQLAFVNGDATARNLPTGVRRGAGRSEPPGAGRTFATDPDAPFAHPFYWAPFILMGNWL
jgi:CHAT domain-containing protein